MPDRLAAGLVLDERWEQLADGRWRQLRLMRHAGQAHLLRVEDVYETLPSGARVRVSQTAMLADRLLISLDTPQDALQAQEQLAAAGYAIERSRSPYLLLIALPGATLEAVPAARATVSGLGFDRAEPDYLRFPALEPDDPDFSQQYAHGLIGSAAAWDVSTGSAEVVLAVIDTGMDLDHPDLAANLWTNPGEIAGNGLDDDDNGYADDVHGWDMADDDNAPDDAVGHGTHVAGIAGAVGGNATGVTGVNWSVSVLPLRIGSTSFTVSAVVEALDYLYALRTEHGVNVVVSNNSYSGEGISDAEQAAIDRQGEAGIIFVAAAGNTATDVDAVPVYPGAHPGTHVVNVANSDDADNLSTTSNFGASTVDLAAPGVDIFSTWTGDSYTTRSGTSMAAPQVAGAVALAFAAAPEADAQAVRDALLASVDLVPALSGSTATGGRLNVGRLLDALTGVEEVELVSPAGDVFLGDTSAALRLEAAVTVAGEAVAPEYGVSWSVVPSAGVTITVESPTTAWASFTETGVYTLSATVMTDGVARSDTCSVTVGTRPVEGGLVAEWLFDGEGDTVADTSGQGHTGALANGAGRGTGVDGGAYAGHGGEFEGVQVGSLPSLPTVSLSAWVRADSSVVALPRVIDGQEWALIFSQVGASRGPSLKFARHYATNADIWSTPVGSVGTDRWYHVAATWRDGDEAPSLYIDGVEQRSLHKSGSGSFEMITGAGLAWLGNQPTGDRGLDGRLDEVRVYDRVLEPEEVTRLAANHAPLIGDPQTLTVEAGTAWTPTLTVTDEDGPQAPALAWSVLAEAGTYTVEGAGTASPVFTFETPGLHTVALVADDGYATVRRTWKVSVDGVYQVFMTSTDGELLQRAANGFPVTVGIDPAPAQALTLSYTLGGDAVAGEDFSPLPSSLTVEAGETEASFAIEALTRTDGVARVLTLTLEPGEGYVLSGDTEVNVTLLSYTYANWAAHYAGAMEGSGSVWSPAFDANGNGTVNLLEFALGIDPLHDADALTRVRLPRVTRSSDGTLSLSYVRPAGADASLYAVGGSPSPGGEPFSELVASEAIESNGDGTETVTVTDAAALAAGETRFLFLKVSADAE
ncbi:MAG: S8 family serine peptidase [Verrucomicrobiota bacterium JB024]|nr:S8 family serine peptidase [Verrucomicrobiota bacterium JB024]